MEDSDGMYGMTGNSIASIFRDQAQIQQVNRRIAAEKQAKDDAAEAKKLENMEKLGMAAYKGSSAYSTKQYRIARDIAADDKYLSEDASGINPFKKGAKRIKLNKKFDALPENEKAKYLLKMKQENPDQFKALSSKEKNILGKVDPKGKIANVNMKTGGYSYADNAVDLENYSGAKYNRASIGTKTIETGTGTSLFDRRNQAVATPAYKVPGQTGPAGNVPGTSYSSAQFEAGAIKEFNANNPNFTGTDAEKSAGISKLAQTNARNEISNNNAVDPTVTEGFQNFDANEPMENLNIHRDSINMTKPELVPGKGLPERYLKGGEAKFKSIHSKTGDPQKYVSDGGGIDEASFPSAAKEARGYGTEMFKKDMADYEYRKTDEFKNKELASQSRPNVPVDNGTGEWSDPMGLAPDPNAMPKGGTLKELKTDDRGVNVQTDQYKKLRDQGISDQAAKDQIARNQLESDSDYQKVMGSEDNYEGAREIAPYVPTEEDVIMDQMINEKMGLEDALPKGEVVPEDVGMSEFQEQGKLTNAAQDAGYGDNIEGYQEDLDAMKSEGFEGTIDEYNQKLELDRTQSIGGDIADAGDDNLESIVENYDTVDAVDKIEQLGDTVDSVEDSAEALKEASVLADASTNLMDTASTGGTLANLADTAGLIDLNDSTKQGIEAAQTAKKAVDTAKAVQAGTVTAATGMSKLMPAVGVVSGAMAAFDKNADTDDRVRGGLTAIGSAMMFTPLAPVGALLTVGSSLWSLFD